MKAQQSRNRKIGAAGPILIALLLTIALLPAAALAAPPPLDGDPPPNQDTPPPNQDTPPPNGNTPGPNGDTPPPQSGNRQDTPPPQSGNRQDTPPPTGGGGQQQPASDAHPDAPDYPSANCIVAHAATPAQLCPVAGGLQYYFIGKDGSTSIGPFISSFSDLASLYTAGEVLLYAGINPLTGKSVRIHYLAATYKVRVSTYYPDTQYDTNKPYTFTVNGSNSVSHIAW